MPLDKTYNTTDVHSQWKQSYHQGGLQQRFDDIVYEWLGKTVPHSGRWVDAGCGTGDLAFRLAGMGFSVTGIDISSNALEVARQAASKHPARDRLRFERAVLEDLPDLEADHVHCRGVLMHIPDWRTALKNLAQQVKPGGYFVVFESNSSSLECWLVRLLRSVLSVRSKVIHTDAGLEFWSTYQNAPFLVRMFDLNALQEEMNRLGLRLTEKRPLFVIDPHRVSHWLRPCAVAFNRLWFHLRLPAASGVILVFRKTGTPKT